MMNFASFYGKCQKCNEVGDLYEELIPVEGEPKDNPKKFRIGNVYCRGCSKNEPMSILNR